MENCKYRFLPNGASTHSFKSISGMASTRQGNIVVCDSEAEKLFLLDQSGQSLRHCTLESTPRDIAICDSNMTVVTFPGREQKLIGFLDVETLEAPLTLDIVGETSTPFCVSNIGGTNEFITAHLKTQRPLKLWIIKRYAENIKGQVKKFCVGKNPKKSGDQLFTFFICNNSTVGYSHFDKSNCARIKMSQNKFLIYDKDVDDKPDNFTNITCLKNPSDVTCDNNGHVYVSGQDSDNIIRLTEDAKVIDVPLNDQHWIRSPTAMCFNRDFSKFYVAVAKSDHGDEMKILCFGVVKN